MLLRKRFVVACFNHLSFIQHYNLVGILYRTQSVSHDNYRFSFIELIKMFHDHALIVGVERVGGFVKEDIVGVLIHGSRYQDTLFLSLAQAYTVTTYLSIIL